MLFYTISRKNCECLLEVTACTFSASAALTDLCGVCMKINRIALYFHKMQRYNETVIAVSEQNANAPMQTAGSCFHIRINSSIIIACSLDGQILELLRSLYWPRYDHTQRPTYRAIASRLGISEWTVRSRMKRMREDGVITDLKIVPRFPFLGLQMMAETYRESALPREDLISSARSFPWIFSLHLGSEYGISVTYTYRTEHEMLERSKIVRESLGFTGEPTRYRYGEKRRTRISGTDLPILRELILHPFVSEREIASVTGLSQPDVLRRINRMAASDVFMMRVAVNSRKLNQGLIFGAMLNVAENMKKDVSRSIAQMDGSIIYSIDDNYSGFIVAMGYARNYEQMINCRDALAGIEGVKRADLAFPVETYPVSDHEVLNALTERISGVK